MTKQSNPHIKKERPDRVPLHDQPRDLLTVKHKKEGMVYRWFNDVENRVEKAKRAGWEIVTNEDLRIGERSVDESTHSGTGPISKKVGLGVVAYLMQIPQEYYEEDQASKQAEITEKEATMRSDALSERYGKLEIGRKQS